VLTTDQKGNAAELAVALAAIRAGVDVYRPEGEGSRYDLVFDLDSRLVRVQCKWAPRVRDVVIVRTYSSRRTPNGIRNRPYTPDEVDAFAAYCPDLEECYFLPLSEFPSSRQIQLRLELPRNGRRAGLNWAEEFTFEARLGHPRGRSSAGRATGRQPVGQGFESPRLHSSDASMTIVGAHEFREHFGWYLERAAAGEEIAVTRRGKPYVRLTASGER
jgi:prevent-host-death family protein